MNGLPVWIPIFIMAALFAGLRDAKRGVVGLGVVIIPAGVGLFYLRNRQRVAQPVR